VAFAFAAPSTRGVEELRVLRVPAGASAVRFQLDLEPDEFARYTAVLKTTGGKTVFSRAGLASRRAGKDERVTLDVPVEKLAEEEYVLTLSAPGPAAVVADYLFRVERR
jgi:hypothetical protein